MNNLSGWRARAICTAIIACGVHAKLFAASCDMSLQGTRAIACYGAYTTQYLEIWESETHVDDAVLSQTHSFSPNGEYFNYTQYHSPFRTVNAASQGTTSAEGYLRGAGANPFDNASADAWASANIHEGTLRARAHNFAMAQDATLSGYAWPHTTQAQSEIRDVLTISYPKTMSSVSFSLVMFVDGEIKNLYQSPPGGSGSATAAVAIFDMSYSSLAVNRLTLDQDLQYIDNAVRTQATLLPDVDGGDHWESHILVVGQLMLTSINSFGASLDFGHTGQLAVELPAGVTFASEGGLLSSPVSEPSAPMLLSVGIGVMALAIRRRIKRESLDRANVRPVPRVA